MRLDLNWDVVLPMLLMVALAALSGTSELVSVAHLRVVSCSRGRLFLGNV